MTLKKKEAKTGWMLILPFLTGFLLLYNIPLGISVY